MVLRKRQKICNFSLNYANLITHNHYMNTHSLKLILFDLDGTLVDTVHDVHPAINKALLQMQLPLLPLQQAKKAIGPGADSFINIILGQVNAHRLEEFLAIFRPIYYEMCTEKSKPFPGIVELLKKLKPDYYLGVATNKGMRTTTKVLEALALRPFFDLVVGPDLVEHGKPAPDMLLFAMNHFAVEPHQVLFIGDTDNDVLAAKAAKICSVAVTWGYADIEILKNLAPDYIFNTTAEICELIRDWPQSPGAMQIRRS